MTAVRVLNFTSYNYAKEGIADIVKRITGTYPLPKPRHPDQPGEIPTVAGVMTFTLAGAFAGLVAAPIACKNPLKSHVLGFFDILTSDFLNVLGPFELAKNVVQTSVLVSNRAQAAPGAARDPSLRTKPRIGTVEAIHQIIKRHGFRGLYTGFHLHALRDTVGTAMYFGIYETVKEVAAKELGYDQSPFGAPAIAGAICSTIPWFCVSLLLTHHQYQERMTSERILIVKFVITDLPPRHPQDPSAERAARKDQGDRRGLCGSRQVQHVQRPLHHPHPDRGQQHDPSQSFRVHQGSD